MAAGDRGARPMGLDVHGGPTVEEAVVLHLQQARSYANYLPGGKNFETVVSEHVMGPEEAADSVRKELDLALALLGARA
ncbi:MAG TPA: hypothetical protein VGE09_06620 [Pseudoxanthomonas sp.]